MLGWMIFTFVLGVFFGHGFTKMYYEDQWGLYNHAQGRAWGWRPKWRKQGHVYNVPANFKEQ